MAKTTTKNMIIVNGNHLGMNTFNMIPTTEDCPYAECIYLPKEKQLVIISKIVKDTFHFMPKINSNGDPEISKGRPGGKSVKEERKQIKAYYEYYLTDEMDIKDFIELMAINSSTFDYEAIRNMPV